MDGVSRVVSVDSEFCIVYLQYHWCNTSGPVPLVWKNRLLLLCRWLFVSGENFFDYCLVRLDLQSRFLQLEDNLLKYK